MTTHAATAAKTIRRTLKDAFPGITFRVRTSNYAGGSSIDISWTDGPTGESVSTATADHVYGSFDGMTDSYTYKQDATSRQFREANGATDYVFTTRTISDDVAHAVRRGVSALYVHGTAHDTLAATTHRLLSDTSFPADLDHATVRVVHTDADFAITFATDACCDTCGGAPAPGTTCVDCGDSVDDAYCETCGTDPCLDADADADADDDAIADAAIDAFAESSAGRTPAPLQLSTDKDRAIGRLIDDDIAAHADEDNAPAVLEHDDVREWFRDRIVAIHDIATMHRTSDNAASAGTRINIIADVAAALLSDLDE